MIQCVIFCLSLAANEESRKRKHNEENFLQENPHNKHLISEKDSNTMQEIEIVIDFKNEKEEKAIKESIDSLLEIYNNNIRHVIRRIKSLFNVIECLNINYHSKLFFKTLNTLYSNPLENFKEHSYYLNLHQDKEKLLNYYKFLYKTLSNLYCRIKRKKRSIFTNPVQPNSSRNTSYLDLL